MNEADMRQYLVKAVQRNTALMEALYILRDCELPDWRIVSGAVYQSVWNALTGRDPSYGIKDYDVGYFDDGDLSYEAEDKIIRQVAGQLPGNLTRMVEVRNQARVHLWFPEKFKAEYPPLTCTDESLTRFVAPAFAVAIRLEPDDTLSVAAPFGLADIFKMQIRPTPGRPVSLQFEQIAENARSRWPEAIIAPAA